MEEKIIKTKACAHCGSSFDITDKDKEFYDKISPIFGGVRYDIPSPSLCPDCRAQRRMAFRNERKLYKRTCEFTGKTVISIYNPESGYKVCDKNFWRSDQRDPMKYGRDFDPNTSFFTQFSSLRKEIPNVAIYNVNTVNSEYANHCVGEKNCYMIFGCYENEDCMYGDGMGVSKNCVDILWGMNMASSYQCIECRNSYKLFRSQKCTDCSESYFLYNCTNSHNCFGCINLNNTSYCIENKQYTKEAYEEKIKSMPLSKRSRLQQYYQDFYSRQLASIHKFAALIGCDDVTGDSLEHVSNVHYCFDLRDAKNDKFCAHGGFGLEDCYDGYGVGANASFMYETVDTGVEESRVISTIVVYESYNAYYSINCHSCKNIFGCIGLRNKEYCILNRQYTKEQYELLVPEIILRMRQDGERGEFFHPSLSPFGYNETIAQEYFPQSREKVVALGYAWTDYEAPFPKVEGIVEAKDVPDTIQQVAEDILQQAIICEVSGKPFRIIRQELEFYRRNNLPLPTKHPDERHRERMNLRNPLQLRDRQCDKCSVMMKSTYAPERAEKVYCEVCYNKEIYG